MLLVWGRKGGDLLLSGRVTTDRKTGMRVGSLPAHKLVECGLAPEFSLFPEGMSG